MIEFPKSDENSDDDFEVHLEPIKSFDLSALHDKLAYEYDFDSGFNSDDEEEKENNSPLKSIINLKRSQPIWINYPQCPESYTRMILEHALVEPENKSPNELSLLSLKVLQNPPNRHVVYSSKPKAPSPTLEIDKDSTEKDKKRFAVR